MKKFKKISSIILIFTLCVNMFACVNDNENTNGKVQIEVNSKNGEKVEQVEGKYPIKWDLSDIYKNDDEWEKDFVKAQNYIEKIGELKGTINSIDGIYNFIQVVMESDFIIILNKLNTYYDLGKSLDALNPTYLDMSAKFTKLMTDYDITTSFFEDEMNKIPTDTLKKYFEDEKLQRYSYYYKEYFDEKRPKYGEEALKVKAQAISSYGASEDVFNAIQYADMKNPKITMPNGETREVGDTLFDEVRFGDYDRAFKKKVEDMYYNRNKDYINALSVMLYNNMKETYNNALLNNEQSVLESSLKSDSIDKKVFDNIVLTTHKLLPELQRFLKIKRERMGYDELYYMDVLTPYSSYKASSTYDEAVDMIRDALKSVFDDEYIEMYDEMVSNNHIDVYPDTNKTQGGFTATLSNKNIKPYILLNFTGFVNEVETIAHEIGHAIFAALTERDVKEISNTYIGLFLHEVSSTFNEAIFTFFRIDNAKTDEEKVYFVENEINAINATLIRQILYTEFEDWLYKKVESGKNFSAEELGDKWMELNKLYYGDIVTFSEGSKNNWANIPHFYVPYYVYKYATSITYSTILANDVYKHKEGAMEKYMTFLKSGESEEPDKILKKAGIDVFDESTYDGLVAYYKELVDQFEELTKK